MRRLHDDVPPPRVHVRDLRHRGPEAEVAPPAVPHARVPKPLRDGAGGRGRRGGEERNDERAPGLAEEDGGDEAAEEEDRDEGGAAAGLFVCLFEEKKKEKKKVREVKVEKMSRT